MGPAIGYNMQVFERTRLEPKAGGTHIAYVGEIVAAYIVERTAEKRR